jgi:hypothetical protein
MEQFREGWYQFFFKGLIEFSGWRVYLQFRVGLPLPSSTALSLLLLLFIQFFFSLFFPGLGLVCPGGYANLAQGCL